MRTGDGGGAIAVADMICRWSVSICDSQREFLRMRPHSRGELTRLTTRFLLPRNTSPFSTHRFHAHNALWSTMYPTTAIHKTGLLSSNGIRKVYRTPPRDKKIEA